MGYVEVGHHHVLGTSSFFESIKEDKGLLLLMIYLNQSNMVAMSNDTGVLTTNEELSTVGYQLVFIL